MKLFEGKDTKIGFLLIATVALLSLSLFSRIGLATSCDHYIEDWYDLDDVRNDLDDNHCLGNDLDEDTDGYDDLVDTSNGWEPIGELEDKFTGTFDGDGHEISGLYINRPGTSRVGLFGYVSTGGEIINVGVVNADVSGGGRVGGIVGSTYESTVEGSYFTGEVSSNGGRVGGIVGANGDSTIMNSYSTGEVSGEQEVGGLVGWNTGLLSNSYSAGEVNGNGFTGGFVGINFGVVSNSYWDNITTGQSTSDGGEGKYTYQMTLEDTFQPEWDFTGTWQIDEWETYPCLHWQDECPEAPEQELTVEVEGEGAVGIEWDEDGSEQRIVEEYDKFHILGGIEVDLRAVPDGNWEFAEWFEALRFECLEHQDEDKCGDQVIVPGGLSSYSEYSLAFWFVQDEKPDVWHYLMDTRDEGAESPWEDFWGPAYDGSDISTTAGTEVPETEYETGRWNHLVITSDGSNTYAYLNGELEHTVDDVEEIDLGDEFRIGNRFSEDEAWIGKIGDVRIYGRALEESEIGGLSESKYLELGDEIAWWKMDEGDGNTVSDLSGNQNHGSIEGADWMLGSPENREISLVMENNIEATAIFEERHNLTVNATPEYGGNVTVEWEDSDGGLVEETVEDEETFEIAENTEVELKSESSDGWEFDGWTGDVFEGTDEITVAMDEDKTITANFEGEKHELTVYIDEGGSVEVDGTEVYGEWTGKVEDGDTVDLEAKVESGYEFTGWTGDYESDDKDINIVMDEDKTIWAGFSILGHCQIVICGPGDVCDERTIGG